MNAYAKLAIAAAAVLVVAFVGFRFLPSNTGTGGLPTPSPSPTPVAPSPGLTPPPNINEGPLAAGTYSLDRNLGITIDVPAGWSGCCEGGAIVQGESTGLIVFDVTNIVVYGDSCHWASSAVSEPRGAEAIAAALAAQPGRQGTEPRDVTVDGRPGFHVRLTVPADLETTEQPDGDATFVDCDQGQFRSWTTAEGGDRYHQRLSQIDDIYIVDVGSRTVVFDVGYFPETTATQRDALDAMVGSIRID